MVGFCGAVVSVERNLHRRRARSEQIRAERTSGVSAMSAKPFGESIAAAGDLRVDAGSGHAAEVGVRRGFVWRGRPARLRQRRNLQDHSQDQCCAHCFRQRRIGATPQANPARSATCSARAKSFPLPQGTTRTGSPRLTKLRKMAVNGAVPAENDYDVGVARGCRRAFGPLGVADATEPLHIL